MFALAGVRLLKQVEPDEANGSIEVVVDGATDACTRVVWGWVEDMLREVPTSDSSVAINAAVERTIVGADIAALAAPAHEGLMHGMMLGALDDRYEATGTDKINPEEFTPPEVQTLRLLAAGAKVPNFVELPYQSAVKQFLDLRPVSRKVFDALDDKAKRQAFTVAGTTKKKVVRVVQRELARMVGQGASLREFKQVVAKRLEKAGWSPLSPRHLETVFRTNTMKAYAAGQWEHALRPAVRNLRPFVQWVGVQDGPPRQRASHQRAHGLVMRIDNPEWGILCAPCSWNCRCRVRTLPKTYQGPVVASILAIVPDLIGKGFTCGVSNLIGDVQLAG